MVTPCVTQKYFCLDKSTFVQQKLLSSEKSSTFVETKVLMLREKYFCPDKNTFVETEVLLSRQKHFVDKSTFVLTKVALVNKSNFCWTKVLLSKQKYFCVTHGVTTRQMSHLRLLICLDKIASVDNSMYVTNGAP